MTIEVAAVAGLVAKLIQLGVTEWRKKEAARVCLLGIASALRVELDQNWVALQTAHRNSTDVSLLADGWKQSAAALAAALADDPFVLKALEQAYSHTNTAISASDRGRRLDAWSDVGRALGALDEFSDRERLSLWKPNEWDCRPRQLGELLAGLPLEVMKELAAVWKLWEIAVNSMMYQPFSLDEVVLIRSYRDPLREAEFRAEARAKWGDNHCFELKTKIFEFWLEPGWRILFTAIDQRLRPLVLVRLTGHEEEDWSPDRFLELAVCRRNMLLKR
jgi:hypothetical protein